MVEPAATASLPEFVQRKPEDGHDLMSKRFAGDAVLEDVYDKKRVLKLTTPHTRGEAVQKVQQALIDFGFPLQKHGADSDFGDETKTAVKAFQKDAGLRSGDVDGVVGQITIDLLDKRAMKEESGSAPKPPAPSPTGTDRSVPNKIDVQETQPQKLKNDTVQQEAQATVRSASEQKLAGEKEPEPTGQLTINLGGTLTWFHNKPPDFDDDKSLDKFCNHGVIQVGGKWNVGWGLNADKTVTLASEPEVDINVAPLACKQAPAISAQIGLIKFKLSEAVDLTLQGVYNTTTKPIFKTGGAALGPVVDVEVAKLKTPLGKVPLKLELGVLGGFQYDPAKDFTTGTISGGLSIIGEIPVIK